MKHFRTDKVWFKRKRYGWGWYPATWEGWVILAVYVGLVFMFALTIDENEPTREMVFTFFLPVTLLTAALIRLCYKTGESPRWQWNEGKESEVK